MKKILSRDVIGGFLLLAGPLERNSTVPIDVGIVKVYWKPENDRLERKSASYALGSADG